MCVFPWIFERTRVQIEHNKESVHPNKFLIGVMKTSKFLGVNSFQLDLFQLIEEVISPDSRFFLLINLLKRAKFCSVVGTILVAFFRI